LIGLDKPAHVPGSSSLCDPDLLVVGLGYVGLPLAAEAARCGLTVVGYDPDHAVVSGLNPPPNALYVASSAVAVCVSLLAS